MLGIIGAMESEIEALVAKMTEKETVKIAGGDFYCGKIYSKDVVIVKCGIGKVCAAAITQVLIDLFKVDSIVNTGVAGGLDDRLDIGDLVIATDAIQYDFDLTPFGYAQGYVPASNQPKNEPSKFATDKSLSDSFKSAASKVMTSGKFIEGSVATGDKFVSDNDFKNTLISKFSASAAEMEGGAIAQVCFLNDIPFTIVRAISDLAGKEATVSFDEFETAAAKLSSDIILEMLKN